MGDLIEFLLSIGELFCDGSEFGVGWRFYLPMLSSLAIVVLVEYWASDGGAQSSISVPVVLAGIVTGLIWESVGKS